MLYEFHILKNYPPTNLNRDDSGSPKSCMFGGVQRSRISSQCLKRSWRQSDIFSKHVNELGIRTRKLPELVCSELQMMGIDDQYVRAASKKVTGFGNDKGSENDNNRTSQIMFFSKADITAVAERISQVIREAESLDKFEKMNVKDWQKKMNDVPVRPITVDIALFGRMVTSDAFADVEASMQVAHAISTHAVNQESDFYTAVDDLVKGGSEDDTGAGMMGDTDFNSSCYYIYAALDMEELKANLKNSTEAQKHINGIVRCLVETMAFTNPSGKQNSFAGHVVPDVIYIEKKSRKIPISYANAFSEPVYSTRQKGLVRASADRLATEIDDIENQFGLSVDSRFWFCRYTDVKAPNSAHMANSFQELLEMIGAEE
ncbi:MAG: type I-E CRISPR-associated protein Cas7/Cse4/CasC [Bacillota bacterium]|nr:type I-E CRISPR-associated protein Cas7/Cse4/CasC [Bacillota bacterium]